MNSLVVRAHAAQAGMGDDVYGQTRPRVVGTLPGATSQQPEWWQVLIGAGSNVLNTWLVTRPGANPYAANPYGAAPQPTAVPAYNTQAVAPAQQIGQGIGTGFSNFAAQFGVTPVTLVILGIVGFYLLNRK